MNDMERRGLYTLAAITVGIVLFASGIIIGGAVARLRQRAVIELVPPVYVEPARTPMR